MSQGAFVVRSELLGFLTPDQKGFTFDVWFAGRWPIDGARLVATMADAVKASSLGFSPELKPEPLADHLDEIRSSLTELEDRAAKLRAWLAEAEAPAADLMREVPAHG